MTSAGDFSTVATHVAELPSSQIPEADLQNAKLRVLDVLGCGIGGRDGHGNAALRKLVASTGGTGEATAIGFGDRLPAAQAALLNAVLVRSNDFEVMTFAHDGKRVPSHITGSTIPAALALAEGQRSSGLEVLAAITVGDDLAARISLASDWSFYLGHDAVGTLSPWASTAAASRLLGLDPKQTRHAFGLSVNQMAGTVQDYWDGSHAFKLVQGTAARDGVLSAQLAQHGWTGLRDPLFAEYGYFRLFAQGCSDREAIFDRLGSYFYGEAIFKAYPSGLPTHTTIDCALALVHDQAVDVAEVDEVVIEVTASSMRNYYAKPFEIRDWAHGDAAFSFQYTTCAALVHGALSVEHFTEEMIRRQDVQELIARSRVVALPEEMTEGARVSVKLANGETRSEYRRAMSGDVITNPRSNEQILEKFWHQVDFVGFDRAKAEQLVAFVDEFERHDDLSGLSELISDTSKSE